MNDREPWDEHSKQMGDVPEAKVPVVFPSGTFPTDRAKALEALADFEHMYVSGSQDLGQCEENARADMVPMSAILRAAIDRAYPPDDDEDGDPVGEVEGAWVVESLVDTDNWQRVFALGMGQGENGVFRDHAKALELAEHHPGRRVRQIAGEASKSERWIIEIQSERGEWARVPLGDDGSFPSEEAANEWAKHMKSARVRRVDS